MSTSTVSMPSVDRTPKPNQTGTKPASSGGAAGQMAAGTPLSFAALMMQAEEPETASTTADISSPLDLEGSETPPPVDPGQAALLGLMNWQGFSGATSTAGNRQPRGDSTGTDSAGSARKLLEATTSTDVMGLQTPVTPTVNQSVALTGTDTPLVAGKAANAADTAQASSETAFTVLTPEQLKHNTSAGAAAAFMPEALAAGAKKPGMAKAGHGNSTSSSRSGLTTTNSSSVGVSADTQLPVITSRSTLELARHPGGAQSDSFDSVAKETRELSDLVSGTTERPFSATDTGSPAPSTSESVPQDIQFPQQTVQPEGALDAQMAETMQQLDAQISYWAAQGTQNASLTVGSGPDNAIEIKVSLSDGEVKVDFLSDDERVREALEQGAQELLQAMLDAKGMSLGSVSVGAQGQHQFGQAAQQGNERRGPHSASTPTVASGHTPNASEARRAPQIISANKLDFYA